MYSIICEGYSYTRLCLFTFPLPCPYHFIEECKNCTDLNTYISNRFLINQSIILQKSRRVHLADTVCCPYAAVPWYRFRLLALVNYLYTWFVRVSLIPDGIGISRPLFISLPTSFSMGNITQQSLHISDLSSLFRGAIEGNELFASTVLKNGSISMAFR